GKKFCVGCGAPLNAGVKFCPACGSKVGGGSDGGNKGGQAIATVGTAEKIMPVLRVVLRYLPLAAFALFAVLTFAFFAAPLVKVMGADLCTVYNCGELAEELGRASAALIVVAVLQICVAVFAAAAHFVRRLKAVRINIFNKFSLSLAKISVYSGCVFYLVLFVTGCVISGKISSVGLEVGACPNLLIAFTVIFAVLTAAAETGAYIIYKKFPEFKREDEEEFARLKEQADNHREVRRIAYAEYVKNLPEPTAPRQPEELDKPKEPCDTEYLNYKKSLSLIPCTVYALIMWVFVCAITVGMGVVVSFIITSAQPDFILGLGLGVTLGIQLIVMLFTFAVYFAKRKFYKNSTAKLRKIAKKATSVLCVILGVLTIFSALGASLGYGIFEFSLSSSIPEYEFGLGSDTCFVILLAINLMLYGLYILIIGCKGLRKAKRNAVKYFGVKRIGKDETPNKEGKELIAICANYEKELNEFNANLKAKRLYGKIFEEYEKHCALWRNGKDYTFGKRKIYSAYKFELNVTDGEKVKKIVPCACGGLARYVDGEGN
ncbi:MAG: zinc ribbon domain-containing protein, partial [Clostridia bacterium]|nr:zinc ribbon domain-containing protein [Clostridia bacterium]